MSKAALTSIRTIDRLERLNNSVNGNPRYRVYFTDGSFAVTSSDAACSYDLPNIMRHTEPEVTITWTKAGRIAMIDFEAPAERETPEEYNAALYYVNLNN